MKQRFETNLRCDNKHRLRLAYQRNDVYVILQPRDARIIARVENAAKITPLASECDLWVFLDKDLAVRVIQQRGLQHTPEAVAISLAKLDRGIVGGLVDDQDVRLRWQRNWRRRIVVLGNACCTPTLDQTLRPSLLHLREGHGDHGFKPGWLRSIVVNAKVIHDQRARLGRRPRMQRSQESILQAQEAFDAARARERVRLACGRAPPPGCNARERRTCALQGMHRHHLFAKKGREVFNAANAVGKNADGTLRRKAHR
ncbi:hypothetical protein D9M69_487530 [compost metagenome]